MSKSRIKIGVRDNRLGRILGAQIAELLKPHVGSATCAIVPVSDGSGRGNSHRWPGQALEHALAEIPRLREEFWQNLSVPGGQNNLNKNLEYAGRVADYLEFAEVLALDALERTESCGGHFREESQTPEGEALRDDLNFSYAAAWEFKGVGARPELHQEPLHFEYVKPSQRSYK